MVLFKIDGQELSCDPLTIDIIPAGTADHSTTDGRAVFIEDQSGIAVTATWGAIGNPSRIIAELEAFRKLGAIHEIAFEDIHCNNIVYINVYMPRLTRNVLGYADGGEIIYSALSVTFRQTSRAVQLVPISFWARGTITTGDGKYKFQVPVAGKFINIEGYIKTLGSGAGQTRFQLSNGLLDYLSTRGDFVVASGTNKLENQILIDNPTFFAGDILELDCDDIPGNSNSADALVVGWAELFKAVYR